MKLLGHSVHQMLIAFPVGLLSTAVIFDILSFLTQNSMWTTMAYYLIAAGIIGGLAAAAFGFMDWLSVPVGTRARAIGAVHGLGNAMVIGLFLVSWLLRRPSIGNPGTLAYTFSFVGSLLLIVTAWLGGELVDRLGVGVDRGAHLNAPSSLSGRPATESTGKRPDYSRHTSAGD